MRKGGARTAWLEGGRALPGEKRSPSGGGLVDWDRGTGQGGAVEDCGEADGGSEEED